MTMKDKDNFKVSFVVLVMGHLLAPTKKHNVGGDRFWGALLAPDEINQFNWAAYVIDELMTAARDVQNALNQKKPINRITGCSILLQVQQFYMFQTSLISLACIFYSMTMLFFFCIRYCILNQSTWEVLIDRRYITSCESL